MSDSSNSLASVGDILLRSRGGFSISNSPSVDNLLGVAASMGLGVAAVRWLLNIYRRPALEADLGGSDSEIIVVQSGSFDAFLSLIRRSLRRLLLDPEELRQYESINLPDEVHVVDGALITHQGSCHCNSVRFEIRAPRTLIAKEGPGKIQYRHTEIKSSNFRVVRGQAHLKTYYVQTLQDRGAHAFCERCGCHILFAPSRASVRLFINVNCIDEGIRKIKVVDKRSSISNAIAVDGQWDDQLTTISEVSNGAYFKPLQFRNLESLSDESVDWKLYDEVDKLEPTKLYYTAPHTPTTVDTFSANATDSQSLPGLRIPRGVPSDAASVITESDAFSVTQSEFAFGVSAPPKALPQLRDQMKYYMKKHVSPRAKAVPKDDAPHASNQ